MNPPFAKVCYRRRLLRATRREIAPAIREPTYICISSLCRIIEQMLDNSAKRPGLPGSFCVASAAAAAFALTLASDLLHGAHLLPLLCAVISRLSLWTYPPGPQDPQILLGDHTSLSRRRTRHCPDHGRPSCGRCSGAQRPHADASLRLPGFRRARFISPRSSSLPPACRSGLPAKVRRYPVRFS